MSILASENSQVFAFSPVIANIVKDTDAAAILQQIHYWIQKENCGRIFDGDRWIYKSYKQWQEEFCWRSIHQIRRCIGILRSHAIIKVEQWTKRRDDKNCFWYTIDYEALDVLLANSANTSQTNENTHRTTCAEKRTSLVESVTSHAESDTISIYTKNTNKITPIENNNVDEEDVVVNLNGEEEDFVKESKPESEEEELDTNFSLSQEDEASQNAGIDISHETKSSAAPRDNKSQKQQWSNDLQDILELIQNECITINTQFKKVLNQYTFELVVEAIEYYHEVLAEGKQINSPQAWLTECLKHRYWETSPKQLAKKAEEEAIAQAIDEAGYRFADRDNFFDTYWRSVDPDDGASYLGEFNPNDYLDASGGFVQRVGYLLIHPQGIFVYTLDEVSEWKMMNWNYHARGMHNIALHYPVESCYLLMKD